VIEISAEQIRVTDLSQRHALILNGHPVTDTLIRDNDIIRIGATDLHFLVETVPLAPPPRPGLPGTPAGPYQGSGSPTAPFSQPGHSGAPPTDSPSSSTKKKPVAFYVILGGLVLFAVYMATTPPPKPIKGPTLITEKEAEKEIEKTRTEIAQLESRRQFKNEAERTKFFEADRHYQDGMRDYFQGQFHRAIKSFETARLIDPGHTLADRYWRLASQRRDEQINDWINEGRIYRDKHMFRKCIARFNLVLEALKSPQESRYKMAEAFRDECQTRSDATAGVGP
jgi:hypothetical protein